MSSQTPYQKIAELSVRHSRQFHEDEAACNRFAFAFGKRLISFLDCDPRNVTHSTPRICTHSTVEQDGMPFENALSTCVFCPRDGYWYFAMSFTYKVDGEQHFGIEGYEFGLRPVDGKMSVRFANDFQIDTDLSDEIQLKECFGKLVDDVVSDYERILSNATTPSGISDWLVRRCKSHPIRL